MSRDLPIPASPESKHHLTFAGLCLRPAPQQQFEFFLPTDEGGQSARVQRLKAALNRAWP